MKILHTSDWHLGARLGDYSRIDEQKEVLEEIRHIAEENGVSLVIIAGDLFDTFNPPVEAAELLYRELKKLADDGRRPVIAIAGNHDSPDRVEAPDPLAAECGIFFVGYPEMQKAETVLECGTRISFPDRGILEVETSAGEKARIITTAYANENRLRRYLGAEDREQKISEVLGQLWKALADKYCDDEAVNLLAAHLFMSAKSEIGPLFSEDMPENPEPEGERSILHPGGLEMIDAALVPPQIQYTALGHLHRFSEIKTSSGSPAVYSGSPLAFGLSEENQQKYAVLIDVQPGGRAAIEKIPVKSGKRILRKRFSGISEAEAWLKENQDCYVELIVRCGSWISAEERKMLYSLHPGITALIPELEKDEDGGTLSSENLPDLEKTVPELFASYFQAAKGSPPDEQLMALFGELSALGEDEE